jgi:hypothetical protein
MGEDFNEFFLISGYFSRIEGMADKPLLTVWFQRWWQAAGIFDADPLVATGLAADQRHGRTRDAAGIGKIAEQVLIGLAIDRWGRDPDLQTAIGLGANDFITAGPGLQANIQKQPVVPPGPGGRCHSAFPAL